MPGIITRRVPKRSSNQPTTGLAAALQRAPSNRALERSPRVIPSSALTGFRKTPEEKISTGPAPTSNPRTDATTTSQRLAKRLPMTLPTSSPPPSYGGGAASYAAEGKGRTDDLRNLRSVNRQTPRLWLSPSGPSGHLPPP